uniref:Uncharacterized protein n=1 Tax=Romanomermis culicivorax TaxID=13658 RepID=A0A915HVB8_ROMCU
MMVNEQMVTSKNNPNDAIMIIMHYGARIFCNFKGTSSVGCKGFQPWGIQCTPITLHKTDQECRVHAGSRIQERITITAVDGAKK